MIYRAGRWPAGEKGRGAAKHKVAHPTRPGMGTRGAGDGLRDDDCYWAWRLAVLGAEEVAGGRGEIGESPVVSPLLLSFSPRYSLSGCSGRKSIARELLPEIQRIQKQHVS